jgi:hypothetical protein
LNAALSGLVGTALGIRTVSSMMQSKLAGQDKAIKKHQSTTTLKRKAAARKFGTRLASRIKRVAAKSIAAIPAESIPFIGVAVLIADTGYELYAACENLRDLDELNSDMGIEDEAPDDVRHDVCAPERPTVFRFNGDSLTSHDAKLDDALASLAAIGGRCCAGEALEGPHESAGFGVA